MTGGRQRPRPAPLRAPAPAPRAPDAFAQRVGAIADDLLFAHALEVDATSRIPEGHFDALADAGLYGIAGPRDAGGLDLDARAQRRVRETLAGGCLTTTLVWTQHQGVVRRLRDAPAPLRDAWLADLCAGRRRGGIVLAGLLPGTPRLRAVPAGGGLRLDGLAPAVSGWGRIDVLLVCARHGDGVAHLLVDPGAGGLSATPLRLAALDGSSTVRLRFDGVRVERCAVVREEPLAPWEAAGEGVRANGALAIGVAGRCARLCDDDPQLHAEVDARRRALDDAPDGEQLAQARAAAALLASRAAAQLVVRRGASALGAGEHAQRLAREAIFLLAFAQRPSIRRALLDGLR